MTTPPPQFQPAARPTEQSAGLNLLLPLAPQSAWAIIAGYLGLLSLIPMLALLTGPLGIVCAVIGLRDIRNHPEKRGTGRCITGIVLGILGIAVSALIVIF